MPMPMTMPASSVGAPSGAAAAAPATPVPEYGFIPSEEAVRKEFDDILDALKLANPVSINGTTKEIYITPSEILSLVREHHELSDDRAGHPIGSDQRWSRVLQYRDDTVCAIASLVNKAASRTKAYVKEHFKEAQSLKVHAPSFLLYGDGGLPHQDALHEYSVLLTLQPGSPTLVFGRPTGESNKELACRVLSLKEEEVMSSSGAQYVVDNAPLLLPRAELEGGMVPAGGKPTWEAGDAAVLAPGCVHQTPCALGTQPRALLFFTLVPDACASAQNYNPLHQVLPMDVLSKVITHGFYPGPEYQLHFDKLVKTYIDWFSHPVYKKSKMGKAAWEAALARIEAQAPESNLESAKKLKGIIKRILDIRLEGQKLAQKWVPCTT